MLRTLKEIRLCGFIPCEKKNFSHTSTNGKLTGFNEKC